MLYISLHMLKKKTGNNFKVIFKRKFRLTKIISIFDAR
jgi:hypothetical protein